MPLIKVKRKPTDPGLPAWDAILPNGPTYGELESNQTADWLVIGAGFAGLSAARRLQQLHKGDTIALIDARRIAEGPAGRNSGFMIDLPHNLASEDYAGALEEDHIQTQMNRVAIDFALAAKSEFEFSPEAITKSGKINAAASTKGSKHNEDYAAHLATLDEHHEMLDAAQMHAICGSNYYQNGLFTPGTALLQPALYIKELAGALVRNGLALYENSPVEKLEKIGIDWQAKTSKGTVSAPKIILAVNGHVESFGFFKRSLMHIYLYASMTRPLSDDENNRLGGQNSWAFTPADPMGTTVRKFSGSDGTRIIVRNRFTWAPSRSTSNNKMAAISKVHGRSFRSRFPMLSDVSMEYSWGGLLCLSKNNVAAFGEQEEGLFSACCQNGLGTAKGTLHGILAAEQASGIRSNHLDYVLNQEAPTKLPPEPFSSIGANAYLRWAEFKAGPEL